MARTPEQQREANAAAQRRYRARQLAKNPNFYRDQSRKYRDAQSAWGDARRDRRCASMRKYHRNRRLTPVGRADALCKSAQARAGRKGIEYTLDRDDIAARIAAGVCEVTGIKFDLSRSEHTNVAPYSPSLDRKDPSRGYTPENVRVVVWIYNAAKGEWGHEDVLALARAITNTPHEPRLTLAGSA